MAPRVYAGIYLVVSAVIAALATDARESEGEFDTGGGDWWALLLVVASLAVGALIGRWLALVLPLIAFALELILVVPIFADGHAAADMWLAFTILVILNLVAVVLGLGVRGAAKRLRSPS